MTVEELLMLAEAHLDYASGDIARDMYAAAQSNAAIAQAAATTAQVMMMHAQRLEYNRDALENARTDQRDYVLAQ